MMQKKALFAQTHFLIIIFVLLATFIVASGILYFQIYRIHHASQLEARMETAANIMTARMDQFFNERLKEIEILQNNFRLQNADQKAGLNNIDLLVKPLMENWYYDAGYLLDAEGVKVHSYSGTFSDLPEELLSWAEAFIASGQKDFDFTTASLLNRGPRLYLMASLDNSQDNMFILMSVDVSACIQPLASSWRDVSQTGKVYIIDPGPQMIQVLEHFSVQGAGSSSRQLDYDDNLNPLVKLAVDGEEMAEGTINGQSFLAYGVDVADTGWILAVTQSEEESYYHLNQMFWMVLLFIGALFLVLSTAVFVAIRDTIIIRRKDRQLEEKNREIEAFTYSVTHDLKGPLVTVKTYLDFLIEDIRRSADMEQINKDAAYIRSATNMMNYLLEELAKITKINTTSYATVFSFKAVATEASRILAGCITQRGVELYLGNEDIMLEGEWSRMLELWQNLIENAVKYMGDQPQPVIEVGLEQVGRQTVFFVKDNGVGIQKEDQDKIFGIFEKLDKNSQGAGIGLAFVKKVVNLHGGTIWVQSQGPATGSIFKFTLPRAVRGKIQRNSSQ